MNIVLTSLLMNELNFLQLLLIKYADFASAS